MVFTEVEAHKKTEILAVCEMCECKIPNAKSCYCNPTLLTFMCIECFSHVPTIQEMELLIEKIREQQIEWTIKKEKYISFSQLGIETPIPPHVEVDTQVVSPL
jgi:hypothetical protein